jgi:hypothetical protein
MRITKREELRRQNLARKVVNSLIDKLQEMFQMTYTPGPKELALKAFKENKAARKPSKSELAAKVAKIQPTKIRKGGGRGR